MRYGTRFQIFAYYLLSVLVLSIFAFRSTSTYLGHPKYYIILLISLPYFIAGIVRTLLEEPLGVLERIELCGLDNHAAGENRYSESAQFVGGKGHGVLLSLNPSG